ncbi:glycoside hydrolase family 3 C-terminal domain-containing protein [Coprococcus comes]|uniref:glycoside hydrolase family 3 C-terminal domain-containing protein n=1 Tax=Coprococcus comes TaxID=410072 RepID=UPI001FABFEC9|nr:glycoside hydrolase family 3 C-terminal domain-containing protein [Coprococcus comes]
MSAYNRYQGAMCGENEYLLRQVLRNEWDFDGFTICDFVWGVKDTVASASSGLDIEMPITHFYGEKLLEVVREGEVTEQTIDESALRIIRTLLAHEHFIEEHKKEGSCDYRKHQELALQCAREGITLLKNEDQLLPIDCKKRKKIVVLGSYADGENIGDRGSSQVYAPYVVTILQGITEYPSDAEVIYYSEESASHCRRLAKEADVVVIVAGNDYLDAVVVLVGGSMILMDEWKDQVGAILMAYYPGMEGGKAVADVLFGKTNPGGKLPFVIPKKEEDLPEIDWDAEEFRYDYYHGYTLLNKSHVKPLYPFGYGLSYTTFTLAGMKAWRDEENLYAFVIAKNTGKREGSEVVQMYVGTADSKVERPEYVLKDFQKIRLDAGEEKEVKLVCPSREMAYFDEGRNEFVAEFSIPYEVYVGTSSLREDLWVRKV